MANSPDTVRVTDIVARINAAHNVNYTRIGKAAGGVNHGAWILRDVNGREAVLKVGLGRDLDRLRRVREVVGRLRSRGYPTPEWILVGRDDHGDCYQVQQRVPGRPIGRLTAQTASQLVTVLERQAGLNPCPERNLSTFVRDEFRAASDHIRTLGPEPASVAERYDLLVERIGPVELPREDLVHGDFNTCNVLAWRGRVSGVIDVDALGSGTRAIDYGWLLRELYVVGVDDPAAIRIVREAGEAVAGPPVLALCVALTAVDIVRWVAGHSPAELPSVTEGLHQLADDLDNPLG